MIYTAQHPELEVLAAFAEGSLSNKEQLEVMAHIASCEHCMELYAETSRFLAETETAQTKASRLAQSAEAPPSAPQVVRPWTHRVSWRAATLIAAGLLVGIGTALFLPRTSPVGTEALVASLASGRDLSKELPRGWEQQSWTATRGEAAPLAAEPAAAFKLGVHNVGLAAAIRSEDLRAAEAIAQSVDTILLGIEAGEAPTAILWVHQVRQALNSGDLASARVAAREVDHQFRQHLESRYFALGLWAGASRLAALLDDHAYFHSSRWHNGIVLLKDNSTQSLSSVERGLTEASTSKERMAALNWLIELVGNGEAHLTTD